MARHLSLLLLLCTLFIASYSKGVVQTDASAPASVTSGNNLQVLCYHQVRDWHSDDRASARTYITPVASFKEQMQLLHDGGYHTILPGQLIAYLEKGEKIPAKTVMLTFDDGTISQYENALPELNKHGFKAVFFIMTVTLNKHGYLSNAQVKQLADQGHVVGCHTWDHHNVTSYKDADWETQIRKPKDDLEQITGRPVEFFAYPNGLWNKEGIEQLKQSGFKCAFQLYGSTDKQQPFFTMKRILADGHWGSRQFLNYLHH